MKSGYKTRYNLSSKMEVNFPQNFNYNFNFIVIFKVVKLKGVGFCLHVDEVQCVVSKHAKHRVSSPLHCHTKMAIN